MTNLLQEELNTLFKLGFEGRLKRTPNDLETDVENIITYEPVSQNELRIKFHAKRSDFGLSDMQSGLGEARDHVIDSLNAVSDGCAQRGDHPYDVTATLPVDETTAAAIKKQQVAYTLSGIKNIINNLPAGIQRIVRNGIGGKSK